MERAQIIEVLKTYFDIRELVCPDVFSAFGHKSWQFFDTQALHSLMILRLSIHKKPMTINNWHNRGIYSQRGLRCNICNIPEEKTKAGLIYMSSHCNGAGFDYDVKGLSAEQARQEVKANSDKFPFKVRLEKNVSWVHFDIYDDPGSINKVTEF
ncbi:MAG: hypothetical protein ACOYOV_05095 [Bacteroidales bacterium]